MKQTRTLNRLAALFLCALLLCACALPVSAAKKHKTQISACSVKLAYTQTVYSGKEKTPAVTVKDGSRTLEEGRHYVVRYLNNVDVGAAAVVIKAKTGGGCSGSQTLLFSIVPQKVSRPVLVKATDTTLKFRWEPVTGATGYVVYRYDAIRNTYHKLKATKKTAAAFDGLQPNTTYLFSVRAYTNTDAGRLYGKYADWLNAKTKRAQPARSKTAAYAAVLQSGTYTVTFTTDEGAFAGAATTICRQGDNTAVETRVSGARVKLLKNADGTFALLPQRKRYAPVDSRIFDEALGETDVDGLLRALTEKADDIPQPIEIRKGKKILERELFRAEDGSAIAFDFDGDTLVELVYYDADGGVNVTTVSAFSPDVAPDAFTIPDDYRKAEISL